MDVINVRTFIDLHGVGTDSEFNYPILDLHVMAADGDVRLRFRRMTDLRKVWEALQTIRKLSGDKFFFETEED
jgi:hypothetical protein